MSTRSKYHYVHLKEVKSKLHYLFDVPFVTTSLDSNHIACNLKFFCAPHKNGQVTVMRHGDVSHRGDDEPRIHVSLKNVAGMAFSPFNLNLLATGAEDNLIKLWKIPDTGLKKHLKTEVQALQGHERKLGNIFFHPTCDNVLVSTSIDKTIRIWDITTGKDRIKIPFKSIPLHVDFNTSGALAIATAKDKKVRLLDLRAQDPVLMEAVAHTSTQGLRTLYMRDQDNRILTSGFGRGGDRELKCWDLKKMDKPLQTFRFGGSSGSLMMFYDDSLGIIYLAGKGEGMIHYFDANDVTGRIQKINAFTCNTPQKGLCMMPKLSLNTMDHEIGIFLKITEKKVIPIRVLFPRKSQYFQTELFPDVAGFKCSSTNKDFFNHLDGGEGEGASPAVIVPPKKISLDPKKRPKGLGPEQKLTIAHKIKVIDKEKEAKKKKDEKYQKMKRAEFIVLVKQNYEQIDELKEAIFMLKQQREGDAVIKEFFQKKMEKMLGKEKLEEENRLAEEHYSASVASGGQKKKTKRSKAALKKIIAEHTKEQMGQLEAEMIALENEKLKKSQKEIEMHFKSKLNQMKTETNKLKRQIKRLEEDEARRIEEDKNKIVITPGDLGEGEESIPKKAVEEIQKKHEEKVDKLTQQIAAYKSQKEELEVIHQSKENKWKTEKEQLLAGGTSSETPVSKTTTVDTSAIEKKLKTKYESQIKKLKQTHSQEKKALESKLIDKKQEKLKSENKWEEKLAAVKKDKKKSTDELQKKIKVLEQEKKEALASASTSKTPKDDSDLKGQLESVQGECEKWRTTNDKLKKDLSGHLHENERMKKKIAGLEKKLEEKSGTTSPEKGGDLGKQNQKLKLKLKKYKESFTKLKETFKVKAEELQNKSKSYVLKLKSALDKERAKSAKFSDQLSELKKSEGGDSSGEVAKLKKEVKDWKLKGEKKDKKYALLKSKVRQQMEMVQEKNKQLITDFKKKLLAIKKDQKSKAGLESENEALKKALKKLKKKLGSK